MPLLNTLWNRLRCWAGFHETTLTEKWYYRTVTVSIHQCNHCPKFSVTAERATKGIFGNA